MTLDDLQRLINLEGSLTRQKAENLFGDTHVALRFSNIFRDHGLIDAIAYLDAANRNKLLEIINSMEFY